MRLGLLYILKENYEDALANLEISVSMDDNDFNKFFNLALTQNKLKKWDKAVASAQKCIDLKRKFGGGWLELGTAEMGKKNNTRAKRHFEEARKDREWREFGFLCPHQDQFPYPEYHGGNYECLCAPCAECCYCTRP